MTSPFKPVILALVVAFSGVGVSLSSEHRHIGKNEEEYRKTFAFTSFGICKLRDGTVASYGYTRGLEGHGGESGEEHGHLIITIVDSRRGKMLLREAYERTSIDRFDSSQSPEPQARGIIADPDHDRVTFLISSNLYRLNESAKTAWHQFQLSTGKPLGVFYPEEQLRDARWLCPCLKAQPLPGTPLLVAQWKRIEGGLSITEFPVHGTHFALLDGSCTPVWQLTIRDDYEMHGDKAGQKRLREWVRQNSAILSVNEPGRFDLYYAKEGQRVSFAANQDEKGKWVVRETARKDFIPRRVRVQNDALPK